MDDKFAAFVAGAIVGRASAPRPERRAKRRTTDPLDGLSFGQRRVAVAVGQIVGRLVFGVFLAYELYVFLLVLR